MRVPLLIGLCVVLAASAAFAGGIPNTGMGAKQMVFQFSGLSWLGLEPYAGGFGFRYFYADDTAIRGSLNFGYGKDETTVGDTKEEETFTEIGAALVWEKYMAAIASVAPYMGIGLGYNYSKSEEPVGAVKEETTANELFIPLVAGFQWYFTESISLGGEYRLSYAYVSGETKEDGTKVEETTISAFGFDTASVFFSVHY
jgi:opacity protein-like surface antigen